MKTFDWRGKKGTYIITLISMIVLMSIFANSFYWPKEGIDKRKILLVGIVFVGVLIVPFLTSRIRFCHEFIQKCIGRLSEMCLRLKKNRKVAVNYISWGLIGTGSSLLIAFGISRFVLRTGFNSRLFYTILALVLGAMILAIIWKNAAHKPERVFVVVALTMGILCISATPFRVGVSWDDEIHYAKTLEISNFLNGIMYEADDTNIVEYGINIESKLGYDRETDTAYTNKLTALYETKACREHAFSNYGIWSVGYIPSAIGIVLARGLGMSYVGVFNMGRLCNLLAYTMLIYFAIKKVKYGKILIACVGLIPTTIFMAASYAYDPWVTGFTILGFSYLVSELQEEAPLQYKNIAIMISMIVIGCMPKAIYFPLLFPLLFMPKKKFRDSKQRKIYYWSIIVAGTFLVATFALPMLIGGAGEGDFRGGSDVNSTEQIKFILQNPMFYVKTLFEYLRDYIALSNSGAMLQRLAYVGHGYFYSIVALILAVVAFLDRGEKEKNYVGIKLTTLIGCAAAIILSATALYISFTAVGSSTVAGMQGRYLVPTIYPALYALGLGGVSHKINKNVFVCVPMILIALTFIYNMICFCVIPY